MAFLTAKDVAIRGMAACVPKTIEENRSSIVFENKDEAKKFIASTGVERRRIADEKTTTSDLCQKSAEKLIVDLGWDKNSIDCLVFVTQTPDFLLPATSCILQDKLGLNEECYTIDISLGCSGWVYGLSVISNLLSSGSFKRGLLLCGDTILKLNSNQDKSAWPLFGDAGTATAIESSNGGAMQFHLATDGSGYDTIIIPDGGERNPISNKSLEYHKIESGIARNKIQLILNGMDVFSFGISKAPQSVNKVLEHFDIEHESVDYFIFHQANMFMNEKIRKKLKLAEEKVPYSIKNFGNTSSASIPLTMVTEMNEALRAKHLKNVACGFGVGLSWGTVCFETDKIVCPELIEL